MHQIIHLTLTNPHLIPISYPPFRSPHETDPNRTFTLTSPLCSLYQRHKDNT